MAVIKPKPPKEKGHFELGFDFLSEASTSVDGLATAFAEGGQLAREHIIGPPDRQQMVEVLDQFGL